MNEAKKWLKTNDITLAKPRNYAFSAPIGTNLSRKRAETHNLSSPSRKTRPEK